VRFTLTKATPLGQAEQSGWTLFRAGLMKGLPIAVGYFAIATTFGLIAVSVGLNVWQAAAMSLFVFAGASQFVALELMAAGTGMAEIVVTTFILNLRHLLMSTVIAERLKATSKWSSILSFGITDETFVVSTVSDSDVPNKKGATLSPAYLGGIMLIAYSWWFAGTVVGSLFAQWIPVTLATSLGVALYAMFIGLLVPSVRRSWKIGAVALISAGIAWGSEWLPGLSGGWGIIVATVVASTLGVILFGKKGGDHRAG
jgi:4-azaleucine resistance transporter AzlC